MEVIEKLRHWQHTLDRWALPIGALGLAAVGLYNWRQWQQDKALLAQKGRPAPRPPLESWPALPLVSVLVAAWDEVEYIERHLESFLALRYPHKELILCAGGEDGTFERAAHYAGPSVKVLRQTPGEGKQRALAQGFPETRGSVIFLTDADCMLDDDAFERTLYPVASGVEQVCTGGSKPLPEQLTNPFVVAQAANQWYGSLRAPMYAAGLLGRNCAIERTLLEQSRGLDAPAPTGTDYVLAKVLDKEGAQIRQMPESRMPTQFPTGAGAYIRQQRRWLRNVALHGQRFGALDERRASLRTSLVGATMLLLPLFGLLVTPWLLLVWGLLAAQALLARLRYWGVATALQERAGRWAEVFWQGPMFLLDLVAWAQPLSDYVRQRDRWRW